MSYRPGKRGDGAEELHVSGVPADAARTGPTHCQNPADFYRRQTPEGSGFCRTGNLWKKFRHREHREKIKNRKDLSISNLISTAQVLLILKVCTPKVDDLVKNLFGRHPGE